MEVDTNQILIMTAENISTELKMDANTSQKRTIMTDGVSPNKK